MARTLYCVPCGYSRDPQVATHLVDDEPMCTMHSAMQPADLERKPIATSPPMCPRGCGNPPHPGRCASGVTNDGKRFATEPKKLSSREAAQIEEQNRQASIKLPKPIVASKKTTIQLPAPVPVTEMKDLSTPIHGAALGKSMEAKPAPDTPRPRRNKGTPVKLDTLKSQTITLDQIPEDAVSRQTKFGRTGTLWNKLLELKPGQVEAVENRDLQHLSSTITHMVNKGKRNKRTVHHKIKGLTAYFWLEPKK